MWYTLQLKNIQVPRRVVAELMREMDPEGCERRKSKALKEEGTSLLGRTTHGMSTDMTN